VLIVFGVALLPKSSSGSQDRLHIRVHVNDKYHTHTHNKVLYKPIYERYYVPIVDEKEPSRHKGVSHFDQWPHGSTVNEQVVGPSYNSSEDSAEDYRWTMPIRYNSTETQTDFGGVATHIVHHPVKPVQAKRPVYQTHPGPSKHPSYSGHSSQLSYTVRPGHSGHPASYESDNLHHKRQLGFDDYLYRHNRFEDDTYAAASSEEDDEGEERESGEERKLRRKGPTRLLFRPVSSSVIRVRSKAYGKLKRHSNKHQPSVYSFTVPN
jgi:hypothetical protein